jgi:hypothetical protein
MLKLRIPYSVHNPVSFEVSMRTVVANLGSEVSITFRNSGQKFK